MENIDEMSTGGRVTRSQRKRLISVDTSDASRPGTPVTSKMVAIPEIIPVITPVRTRRNSLSTPVKTPLKSITARAQTPDVNSPARRLLTRRVSNTFDVEEATQNINNKALSVVRPISVDSPAKHTRRRSISITEDENNTPSKLNKLPRIETVAEEDEKESKTLQDIKSEIIPKKQPAVSKSTENLNENKDYDSEIINLVDDDENVPQNNVMSIDMTNSEEEVDLTSIESRKSVADVKSPKQKDLSLTNATKGDKSTSNNIATDSKSQLKLVEFVCLTKLSQKTIQHYTKGADKLAPTSSDKETENQRSVKFNKADDDNAIKNKYPKTPILTKSKSYIDADCSKEIEDEDKSFRSEKGSVGSTEDAHTEVCDTSKESEGIFYDATNEQEPIAIEKTPHRVKLQAEHISSTPIGEINKGTKNVSQNDDSKSGDSCSPDKLLRSGKIYGTSPIPLKVSPKPEENLVQKSEPSFSKSWSQSVCILVTKDNEKIDNIAAESLMGQPQITVENTTPKVMKTTRENTPKCDLRSNVENEGSMTEENVGSGYCLDEAEDAGVDYESGDSMSENERLEIEDNEIVVDGESIGTEDTEDERGSDNDEPDKGSFIATSDEEQELLEYSDDDEHLNTNEKKNRTNGGKYKRIQLPSDDSGSEADITAEMPQLVAESKVSSVTKLDDSIGIEKDLALEMGKLIDESIPNEEYSALSSDKTNAERQSKRRLDPSPTNGNGNEKQRASLTNKQSESLQKPESRTTPKRQSVQESPLKKSNNHVESDDATEVTEKWAKNAPLMPSPFNRNQTANSNIKLAKSPLKLQMSSDEEERDEDGHSSITGINVSAKSVNNSGRWNKATLMGKRKLYSAKDEDDDKEEEQDNANYESNEEVENGPDEENRKISKDLNRSKHNSWRLSKGGNEQLMVVDGQSSEYKSNDRVGRRTASLGMTAPAVREKSSCSKQHRSLNISQLNLMGEETTSSGNESEALNDDAHKMHVSFAKVNPAPNTAVEQERQRLLQGKRAADRHSLSFGALRPKSTALDTHAHRSHTGISLMREEANSTSSSDDDADAGDKDNSSSGPCFSSDDEEQLQKVMQIQKLNDICVGGEGKRRKSFAVNLVDSTTNKERVRHNRASLPFAGDMKPSQSFVENIERRKYELQEKNDLRKQRLSKSFTGTAITAALESSPVEELREPHLIKKANHEEPKQVDAVYSSTPHAKMQNDGNNNIQRILGRCDEILEAANRAKFEAKRNNPKKNTKLSKKLKGSKKSLQACDDIETKLIKSSLESAVTKRKEHKMKEKTKLAVEKALKASADILSREGKARKKERKDLVMLEASDKSKYLPTDILEAITATGGFTSSNEDQENKHSEKDIVAISKSHKLRTAAGEVLETPLTPQAKKKVHKFKLATGVVSVEPSTPKKKLPRGFRESPITPRKGFKISQILTAGQDVPPAMPLARNKLKRKIEEPQLVLPKPRWTPSGFFMEETLPQASEIHRVGATQFVVCALNAGGGRRKAEMSQSLNLNALNFKNSTVIRANVVRESSRSLLQRKERARKDRNV